MESYTPETGLFSPSSNSATPVPITMRDIWDVLRRRALLVAVVFVATVGASLFVTSLMKPVYEASCQLAIDNAPPAAMPSSIFDLLNNRPNSSSDLAVARVNSRTFLAEVIRRVKSPQMTEPDALRGALSVSFSAGDQLLTIKTTVKNDPKLASDLANAVAEVYIDSVRNDNDRKLDTSSARLEKVQKGAEKEKDAANEKLQAFMKKKGLSDLDPYYGTQASRTINIKNALDDARRELPIRRSNIDIYTKEVNTIAPNIYSGTTANRNPLIDGYYQDISRLELDREIKSKDFGPRSSEIAEVDQRIAATKAALKRLQGSEYSPGSQGITRNPNYGAAVTGLHAAQRELKQTQDLIAKLEAQLATLQAEQEKIAPEQVEYADLKLMVKTSSEAYTKATVALTQMPFNAIMAQDSMKVLEPARVPLVPKSPKPLLNTILGIAFGLILGISSAIVAEYFTAAAPAPGEPRALGLPQLPAAPAFADGLPRLSGVPVLARVPLISGRTIAAQAGAGLPTTGESAATEDAFREIGYLLSHPLEGAASRVPVILMAGTRSDETTASVAAYLTATLVRDGVRVTLVDGDRTEPRLHKVFGKPDAPGVTDILAGRVSAADALHTGANGNLRFLAAGAKDDPTPLGEETLRKLYDEIGRPTDTDLVVISGPSVWAARLVAPMERAADGVVLVASDAQIAPAESVARARRILSNGYQPRLVGVIVGEEEAETPNRTKTITEGKT